VSGTRLQFNLAHSHGVAVIAVAGSGAVGIDIERVRPLDVEGIINSFFSTAEVEVILAQPPADRLRAFFTCWTRKEAYLKATGDGIAVPLDRFSVSAIPGSPPRLLHVEGAPFEETCWSFHDLPLAADYVGVVALEGPVRTVRHCLWRSR
jgi:4'-phosphopantetheinyl transferase